MLSQLHCSWVVMRKNIMAEGCGGVKLLTLWQLENSEDYAYASKLLPSSTRTLRLLDGAVNILPFVLWKRPQRYTQKCTLLIS
jgi:hypothetical protein